MGDISVEKTCELCGLVRRDADVYLECFCHRKAEYASELEKTIKSEVEVFNSLYRDSIGRYSVKNVIKYFCYRMHPETRKLLNTPSNAEVFKRMHTFISDRRSRLPGKDAKINAEISMFLYMKPRFARMLKYQDCLFVSDNKPCGATKCDVLCSAHIGWMYVAHNELSRQIPDDIARECLEYIQPEYQLVPACSASSRKRKA